MSASRRRPVPPRSAALLAVLALLVASLPGCRIETAENPELQRATSLESLENRVASMLEASAAGWNAGDLDAFMAVYAESEATTYVGGTGLRIGYEAIRQRYAPLFRRDADRDSLRFEDLRVRTLGPDVALGIARYVLHEGDEVTGQGPFTLVLRRVGEDWRIVHDHSSSDPEFVGAGSADSAGDADPAGASGSSAGEGAGGP